MTPTPSKAAHYVQLLDAARADGDWDAVPEWIRKVKKHAPERSCLTLTAETELSIEKATRNLPAGGRPSSAVSAKDLEVASQLPKLLAAIDAENTHSEDKFQGRVCIGWLHWVVGEYNLAFVRLPKGLDLEGAPPEGADGSISDWTRVCALKSAYLRANCLARNGSRTEALAVFEEGLPCLTSSYNDQQSRKQLRYWSELFLTEYCMLFSHALEQGEVSLEDANCLASFRTWARYWEGPRGASLSGGYGFRGSVPRRRIWYEYYAVLSSILQEDLPFPTAYIPAIPNESSARNQLRMELKKVEAAYEALLLSETEFPRANEEREEVEAFVSLVMRNWAILKGRGWRDQDAGPGGKESLSRGVLDILYRASTKTYHSTSILRHLFTVHLAVAEFDLAFKAFDSYLDLIKRGKARVAKTGHLEPSLDEDSVVLETVSLCIAALCRYGDRQAAEKARDLGLELEQCVYQLSHRAQEDEDNDSAATHPDRLIIVSGVDHTLPPRVVALTWQSIGLANAQWARMTYDSTSRPEIQSKAVRALRKSISPEFGRSANLRGVFALGILLAEQRELAAAIELVKTALLCTKTGDDKQDLFNGPYWRERALIPLWHLLSLLLSARQDYVMAARACEGAFEQFEDPAVLFGSEQLYRSDHLNEAEAHNEKGGAESGNGVVDEMDDFEKESILEVKMTQLALIEVLEGPKVAVNASLELLSLFARLFGSLETKTLSVPPKTADVPKSSAGTLRSIKGSIFGRHSEKTVRPAAKHASIIGSEKVGTIQSRPQTTQTTNSVQAPTIQITKENGATEDTRRPRKSVGSQTDRRSQSGRRNSLLRRDRSGSRRRAVSSGGAPHQPTVLDGESYFTPLGGGDGNQTPDFFQAGYRRRMSTGPPVSMSRQISQVESRPSSTRSRRTSEISEVAGVDGIEPTSSLMPLIQFSGDHEKRQRTTILIRVWLMIAGFYRRAGMFDDARAAIAEAQKLVQGMETEVVKDASGLVSLRNPGWAGKKSIEELWGDVWAEMGSLSLAKETPYVARADFESALTHFPDHPAAIVGLSNILLDIYSEKLLPTPVIAPLELADGGAAVPTAADPTTRRDTPSPLPSEPLGLGTARPDLANAAAPKSSEQAARPFSSSMRSKAEAKKYAEPELVPPYKATSVPVVDRLAARDRAYALLSGLTRLGSAWNYSEAWFTLARAHEESGQPDKAKEVLWWCVELEEALGVREWTCVGAGGYVL